MRTLCFLLAFSLYLSAAHPEPAKEPEAKPAEAKPEDKAKKDDKKEKDEKPKSSVTKHSITIGGQKIDYTATAGLMPLKDRDGKTTTASIFYIAYTRDGVSDAAKRPLTF